MKIAVCLVVKNEAEEIPYWLAWYKTLGFDSFIIYDDFSEDSTESVILSLSSYFDIRYSRNEVDFDIHHLRQIRAYNDAIVRYKNEFDWIAFFDADEYLDLYGDSIKNYLNNLEPCNGVAFNWCNFGTNNHVSRPSGPPFLNYTKHGKHDLFWNKHTKVIINPKSVISEIYQVHNMPISGHMLASDGSQVQWESEIGGITKNPPNWVGGRLMHFQTRSLEHYVKRDRNLEDIRRHDNDPLHVVARNSDYSAINGSISPIYLHSFSEIMRELSSFQSIYIMENLNLIPNEILLGMKELATPPKNIRVFHSPEQKKSDEIKMGWVSNHKQPGNALSSFFSGKDNFLFFKLTDFFGKTLFSSKTLMFYQKGSQFAHIILPKDFSIFMKGDPRVSNVLTYKIWQNEDGSISFSHPRTHRYLGVNENSDINCRKIRALDWEKFFAEKISFIIPDTYLDRIVSYLSETKNFSFINNSPRPPNNLEYLFLNYLAQTPSEYFKSFQFCLNDIIQEHLY